MASQRKPRKRKLNVDNVMAAIALRDEMRSMARQRQAFAKANAPWKRIVGKLVALVIVSGVSFVLVAHHLAYTAAPLQVAMH
jgi:hypothetical protein